MGVLSNRVDRDSLKPGDHIYSWRTGYIYAHHGIYVRDNKVIHFTRHGEEVGTGTVLDLLLVSSVPAGSLVPCPTCILPEEGHGVFSSCLDCFLAGGILYRFEYSVSHALFLVKARGGTCTLAVSDPEDIVVHRANYLLENGFGCYNVFKNNCEDFAIYCKTGLLVMDQKTVGMSGQAASIIGGPLAAVLTSPLRLVTNNVFGMVATAVGVYCATRYAADIGMRKDVVKVPVEEMTERLANGTLQVAMQEVSPASALPNAQEVANAFVDHYYPVLHHSPDMLHKFYLDSSVLNWPNTNGVMTSVTTMQAINEKILSSDYKNYKVEIKTTDAQKSCEDGVTVVITGCLTGKDNAKRNFTQTFLLSPQETGYVVLNDLFRYIDESESLEIGSVSVNGVTENAPTAYLASDPEPNMPTDSPHYPSSDPATTFETEDLNNSAEVSDPLDNIDGKVLVEEVVDELPIHSSRKEIISSVSSDIAPAQEQKKSYAPIVKITKVAKASTPFYVPPSRARVVPTNADHVPTCRARVVPAKGWGDTNPHDRSEGTTSSPRNSTDVHFCAVEESNARIEYFAKRLDAMEAERTKGKLVLVEEACAICDQIGHPTKECPALPIVKNMVLEQANAMGGFKRPYNPPYGDNTNPSARWSQPAFNYRNDQGTMNPLPPQFQQPYLAQQSFGPPPSHSYAPPQIQHQGGPMPTPYVPPHRKPFEEPNHVVTQRLSQLEQSMQTIQAQLAQLLQSQQVVEKGKLPAQPLQNPKGQMSIGAPSSNDSNILHAKAITTLLSGKIVDYKVQMPSQNPNSTTIPVSDESEPEIGDTLSPRVDTHTTPIDGEDLSQVPGPVDPIPPPFPPQLMRQVDSSKANEMLELFKQVKINTDKQSLGSPKSPLKPEAAGPTSAPESKHANEEVKGHSVYVRNLPFNATDTQLEEVLKKFGPIKRDGIQVRSYKQGFCFGFVEFESFGSMVDAIKASPLMIGGHSAVVEEKRSTAQVSSGGRGRYPSGSGRGGSRNANGNYRGHGNFGGGRGYRNHGEFSGRSKGPSGRGGGSNQRVDQNASG